MVLSITSAQSIFSTSPLTQCAPKLLPAIPVSTVRAINGLNQRHKATASALGVTVTCESNSKEQADRVSKNVLGGALVLFGMYCGGCAGYLGHRKFTYEKEHQNQLIQLAGFQLFSTLLLMHSAK